MSEGGEKKKAKKMFRVMLKSGLEDGAREVKLPCGGSVGDLKRVMYKHYPKHGVVASLGGRELSRNSETLEAAGVREGVAITVTARMKTGLHGTLDQNSLSSEGSEREGNGPAGFFIFTPFFGQPPPNPPPEPAPSVPKTSSASEQQRQEAATKKSKDFMQSLRKRGPSKDLIKVKTRTRTEKKAGAEPGAGTGERKGVESSSSLSVASATDVELTQSEASVKEAVAGTKVALAKDKCGVCGRKVGPLQRVECRCRRVFCPHHRDPLHHNCTF